MVNGLVQLILEKRAMAFAVIACAVMAIATPIALHGSIGNDYGMYFRVANEPLANAYIPYSDLPFPYLPTMILWITPLAYLPMWPSYVIWIAISAAIFGLACRRYMSGPATALALASPPLIFCYLTGQVSAVLAALLLWACGTRSRVAAGIAFAVIASMKPQLVIMAPLLLLFLKDWRALAASVVAFCLIVAASLQAYGLDTWFVWLGSLDEFHEMVRTEGVFAVAVTPAAMAEYWGFEPLPILIVTAAIGAYLVVRCRHQPPLILSAALGCGSLLAAPYALIHDLAVVMPFLAWSVLQGRVIAALALPGAIHPLPLALTAVELIRRSGRGSGSTASDESDLPTALASFQPVIASPSRPGTPSSD